MEDARASIETVVRKEPDTTRANAVVDQKA
jgi:hypothetical protein